MAKLMGVGDRLRLSTVFEAVGGLETPINCKLGT